MSRPDIEARLRAAYDARARLANVDDWAPAPTFTAPPLAGHGAHQPHGPRSPWRTLLLAGAAAVVVAAASVGAVTLAHRHTSPAGAPTPNVTGSHRPSPTTPAPSPTVTTPAPVLLPLGQLGTRAQVPWSLVGAGWTVVTWVADGAAQSAAQPVFLVDPLGGRYSIASVPGNAYVADVSGDHQRVLLGEPTSSTVAFVQLDLHTGALSHVTDTPAGAVVEYTKPQGLAVLVAQSAQGRTTVQRLQLDGTVQHQYPSTPLDVAWLPLYTPDGTTLVFVGVPAMPYMANDGTGARTLPVPAGASVCRPVSWWTPAEVLADCSMGNDAYEQLWIVPVDGSGGPTALTHPAVTHDGSYFPEPVKAWQYGSRIVGWDAPSCGPSSLLSTITPDGAVHDIALHSRTGSQPPMVVSGAAPDGIYGRIVTNCSATPGGTLVRFEPATSTMTILLGASVGGGNVTSAATIGAQG